MSGSKMPPGAKAPCPELSADELRCLVLAGEGLASAAIAAELFLPVAAVEAHLDAAGRKLGARNRLNAVSIALLAGLIRHDLPAGGA